jgi:hypothetical protein
MSSKHFFHLACAATLLTACGGDDGGDGGDEPVPLSELDDRLGATVCARMVECCTTQELMDELLGAENQAECEALYTGFVGQLLIPALEDSVANGRLLYDGTKLPECLDGLAALACPELRGAIHGGLGNACSSPFTGLVELGGTCAGDVDCISHFCDGDSVDLEGTITFGTCTQLPTDGQPCVDDTCGPGLRCERDSQTGTCGPTFADGVACTYDDDCTSGDCVGPSGSAGTCGDSMTCDGL